jgi:hypothetical protein
LQQKVVVLLLDVGGEDGIVSCQLTCALKHLAQAEGPNGSCVSSYQTRVVIIRSTARTWKNAKKLLPVEGLVCMCVRVCECVGRIKSS